MTWRFGAGKLTVDDVAMRKDVVVRARRPRRTSGLRGGFGFRGGFLANRLNTSVLAAGERACAAGVGASTSGLDDAGSSDGDRAVRGGDDGGGLRRLHIGRPWFLWAVVVGLFLNWFGDSLDGTLARHRGIERPRYGFLLDHSSDLIAQSLIVVGLGISPYFTLPSALFVLSLYLLMSSYTYLRVATEGVHRLSYGGMGATEFRIWWRAGVCSPIGWAPGDGGAPSALRGAGRDGRNTVGDRLRAVRVRWCARSGADGRGGQTRR